MRDFVYYVTMKKQSNSVIVEVIENMGIYFNPGNGSFLRARNSQIFVDKTGLIEYLNKRLCTEENCIAVSHARRFGKSHAAGMIDAYYSLGSESSCLFDDV